MNAKTKHTPGPWHYHDLGADWCFSGPDETNSIIAPETKPTDANARLIASAPDLLAENERLRTALQSALDVLHWASTKEHQNSTLALESWELARAALGAQS